MRSETVDIDGPVHVADFGGSGEPMVLVHGLGGSHVNWMAVAPRLAERHHVLAPDLAGFGLTPPAGRSAAVQANAALLTRYLETLGRPVVLVGNSMGGLVSILVASRRPELVRTLILVDPAVPTALTARPNLAVLGTFVTYAIPGLGQAYVRRRAERLGPEGLVRETMKLCTVDMRRIPADVYAAHVDMARRRRAFPHALDAYIEAARSVVRVLAQRRGITEAMRRISAPTLLLQGREDRLVALASAQLAARTCPAWKLVVLDDVGHVPQLEVPDRFVDAVLDFLDSDAEAAA